MNSNFFCNGTRFQSIIIWILDRTSRERVHRERVLTITSAAVRVVASR